VTVQAHVRARPRITPRRPSIVQTSIAAAEPLVESVAPPIDPAIATVDHEPAPDPADAVAATVSEPSFDRFGARPTSQSLSRTPWAPLREPAPTLVARPYQRHISYDVDAPTTSEQLQLPGAYRPPSLAPAGQMATTAPRWPTASAMAANAAVSATAIPRADLAPAVSMKRDVDAATFVEIAGWFVIVGATMSVLGFLLPWSVTVIGARGVGGYFNGWGLASPTHVLVFAGLLIVLALGIMRTRVPGWLRTGVLGLVVGGLLVGLVWPYIVGPLGADVGVTVTALGGLALVIGGALSSWATRHGAADPGV
jgi:hypothetical protein